MSNLHADSIRKTFDGRNILNDIFISCHQGEIVGLLGRNGSGKSTLLKVIFGSLNADYKFVSVDEKKTGKLYSTRHLIRYLPQHNFLPDHKKIKHIISCFCNSTNAIEIRDNNLIKPLLEKKAKEISGGERRIVEVLLMVYSEAKILLFDEPFNGISPINVETIKTIFKSHSKDKAIIITDHDYENVINISSRIVLMQDGNTRIIKDLTELVDFGYLPQAVCKANLLENLD